MASTLMVGLGVATAAFLVGLIVGVLFKTLADLRLGSRWLGRLPSLSGRHERCWKGFLQRVSREFGLGDLCLKPVMRELSLMVTIEDSSRA